MVTVINKINYKRITPMEASGIIMSGEQDVYSIVDNNILIHVPTLKYWIRAQEEKNSYFAIKAKVFNTMGNIGKAKYVINTFNGKDKHKDGSDFYGIETFSNKVKFNARVKELINDGWIEQ